MTASLPGPDHASCDAEPIQVPGAIQAHGALIVVDPDTLRVLQTSANVHAFTGLVLAPGARLGTDDTTSDDESGGEVLAAAVRAWQIAPDGPFQSWVRSPAGDLSVLGRVTGQG